MRHWVLDQQAETDIQHQIDFLIEAGAFSAAQHLLARIKSYLRDYLTVYPATGMFLDHRGLWEIWIPGTRIAVWYRYNDIEIQIARVWHTAQDRQNTPQ